MKIQEKKCSKCGEVKSVEEFSKNKSRKTGIQIHCKKCCEAYRKANKDKAKVYGEAYREVNVDKRKAYDYEYRKINKDKIKAYREDYEDANKDKIKAISSVYRKACVRNLTDSYICDSLSIPISQAEENRDLIELKRVQLLITRKLKK
jgi:hypothetical protein